MAAPATTEASGGGPAKPGVASRLASWLTPQPGSWSATFLYAIVIAGLLFANAVKAVLLPLWRRFGIANPPPLIVRTPESRFSGLNQLGYDFEGSNYVSFPNGGGLSYPRMHYIDEGPKEGSKTILCLHGEPSWSFLYRKMVPVLVRAGYRVVVPDFIGFGKSDKYTNPNNYTHELHMATLRLLLDHLGLSENVILVCQDWGGLTGLSVVKDMKDTFEALVIMNTGLPTGGADKTMDDGLTTDFLPFFTWRLSVALAGNRLPVKFLFRYVLGFSEEVADAYDAPFPDWRYRGGAAQWPLLVPLYKDDPVTPHMVEAIKCLKAWSKPALLMFGDQDPVTRGIETKFMKWIPTATKINIKGAGHMIQESHGKELANHIVDYLDRGEL